MAGIIESTKQVYGQFMDGTCVANFKKMSFGQQALTVLKVIGIALAAGIIAGILGGFGGGALGFILGVGFAAAAGTAAFAYFTSETKLGDELGDLAGKLARNVKEALIGKEATAPSTTETETAAL